MKTNQLRFIFSSFLLLSVIVGCGGGGGSSSPSTITTDPNTDIISYLEEETVYAHEYVKQQTRQDKAISDVIAITKRSGLSLEDFSKLAPEDIPNRLTDAEMEAITALVENTVLPSGVLAQEAIKKLYEMENGLVGSDQPYLSSKRILPAILGAIGIVTLADIATACYEPMQEDYYNCYNTKMNQKFSGDLTYAMVPTASIGIGAYCMTQAVTKVEKCKETATMGLLTSFSSEVIGPFSSTISGTLNVKSLGDSLSNIKKNITTIYTRWRDGDCNSPDAPFLRNTEKEWLYITQTEDGKITLPEGYWDILVFSDDHVRARQECHDINANKESDIYLTPLQNIEDTVIDSDNDGYSEAQGDCQDNNLAIYPSALEICNDAIDNNCDGAIDCDDVTCSADAACYVDVNLPATVLMSVNIAGYSSFQANYWEFSFGNLNDGPAIYPGFVATDAYSASTYNWLKNDNLTLLLNTNLSAGKTYQLGDAFDLINAGVWFITPEIVEKDGTPVLFTSQSGSITLSEYGTSTNSKIAGRLNVTVQGDRDESMITGTISGTFNGTVKK
jgi:hypothetical protein